MISIKEKSVVLFQGDSVTDCRRNRNDEYDLGNSYVKIVGKYLRKNNVQVINRAISGNKVNDLLTRFQKDFVDCKPNYIFILIGVNDTWHNYPNQKATNVFIEEYDLLLKKIKDEISVPVVILEPFIIGYKEEYTCMRGDLLTKVDEIRKLAKKYHCEYIAFENDFATVLIHEDEELYSIEGIHPLEKGYKLMAKKIIKNIKTIK